MTGIATVSRTQLAQRRRQLQQRRRVRFLQMGWRGVALLGLAGGIAWGASLPIWVLRSPAQIQVEGNYYIPTDKVRSLVPLNFPQSLFRLEPKMLAQAVASQAPLADVKVHRQLVPPALVVQIQERYPVAIALLPNLSGNSESGNSGSGNSTSAATGKAASSVAGAPTMGLLDANGTWIPLESYTALDRSLKLPSLKVIGNPDQYRSYWASAYQEINRSPVKISEVDWQDVNNLILKTELGLVRVGPYGPQFSYQLSLLDRMRKLPNRMSLNQIAYINLINPNAPTVQLAASPSDKTADKTSGQ